MTQTLLIAGVQAVQETPLQPPLAGGDQNQRLGKNISGALFAIRDTTPLGLVMGEDASVTILHCAHKVSPA